MKTHYNISMGLVVLFICIAGCKKFVQITPPTSKLVTASVFNNNAAATAAQTSIYSQMVNNGESIGIEVSTGLLGDELTNYYNSIPYTQLYTDAMTALQAPGPWSDGYSYIYQENAVMAAVQGNAALSSAVSQQLLGESKFLRAFWFFYLTNAYGDIPLVTSTDYNTNATISRTPRAQVYQQIIADLKSAQSLLNASYVDASDTTITKTDRTRPTRWAAMALLSRVYLYSRDYLDAEAEADSVINTTSLYTLCPNLNNVFLVNSPEAIWQLGIPLPTNYNTPDGENFILIAAPGASSINCCSIAPQLLNSFELNDARRTNWIDSFKTTTTPITTYYYSYKYKVRTGSSVTEDVMVLRLAEQYLIRAEARALQGNIGGAISDLNTIRSRAGLASYSGPSVQQSLLTAILHERKVELFTEWGHRWFDMVRTSSADSVMSIVAPSKSGIWSTDEHQTLFPIPQSERTLDPNLSQNMGY